MNCYFTSYAGGSGRLHLELSAHQAIHLSELLEKFAEEFKSLFVEPAGWYEGVSTEIRNWWFDRYANSAIAQEISDIVSTCYSHRVHTVLPHSLNAMYQVFTGNPPINEFPEVLLKFDNGHEPCWFPYNTFSFRSILVSQLKEEGISLLDREALVARLERETKLFV